MLDKPDGALEFTRATRNSSWFSTQVNAYCEGCDWVYYGSTGARDAGQSTVVRNAREHCSLTGHKVRVERGQARYTLAVRDDQVGPPRTRSGQAAGGHGRWT